MDTDELIRDILIKHFRSILHYTSGNKNTGMIHLKDVLDMEFVDWSDAQIAGYYGIDKTSFLYIRRKMGWVRYKSYTRMGHPYKTDKEKTETKRISQLKMKEYYENNREKMRDHHKKWAKKILRKFVHIRKKDILRIKIKFWLFPKNGKKTTRKK